MISIFRRVRQKLPEENRITRYPLYAVGEILLVVIGILIALQVNNWNEERKDAIRGKLSETSNVIRNEVENREAKGEKDNSPLEGSGGAERSRGVYAVEDYQPKLTVRTHQTNKSVTIDIQDNGPGIPDDVKDKILQPFFTTKKGTQGTGLGLSITNDIVKAHGGRLDINSEPGQTQFRIILNA